MLSRIILIFFLSLSLPIIGLGQNTQVLSKYIFRISASDCEYGKSISVKTLTSTGFLVQNQPFIIASAHGVCGCKTIRADRFPNTIDNPYRELEIDSIDFIGDVAYLSNVYLKNNPKHYGFKSITSSIYNSQFKKQNIELNVTGFGGNSINLCTPKLQLIDYSLSKSNSILNEDMLNISTIEDCYLQKLYNNTRFDSIQIFCSNSALPYGFSGAPLYFYFQDTLYVIGLVSRIKTLKPATFYTVFNRIFSDDLKIVKYRYNLFDKKLSAFFQTNNNDLASCLGSETSLSGISYPPYLAFLSGLGIDHDKLPLKNKGIGKLIPRGKLAKIIFCLKNNDIDGANRHYTSLCDKPLATIPEFPNERVKKIMPLVYYYLQLYRNIYLSKKNRTIDGNKYDEMSKKAIEKLFKLDQESYTIRDLKFKKALIKKKLIPIKDLIRTAKDILIKERLTNIEYLKSICDFQSVISEYDTIRKILLFNDTLIFSINDSILRYKQLIEISKSTSSPCDTNSIILNNPKIDTTDNEKSHNYQAKEHNNQSVIQNNYKELSDILDREFKILLNDFSKSNTIPIVKPIEERYGHFDENCCKLLLQIENNNTNITSYLLYDGYPLGVYNTPGSSAVSYMISKLLNRVDSLYKIDTMDIRLTVLGTADMIPFKRPLKYSYEFGDLTKLIFKNFKDFNCDKTFSFKWDSQSAKSDELEFRKLNRSDESNPKLAFLRAYQIIYGVQKRVPWIKTKEIHAYSTVFKDKAGPDCRRIEILLELKRKQKD